MGTIEENKEINTKEYYQPWQYYKIDKVLMCASHWIDDSTGESIKLTHNLKAVYFYKWAQYQSYSYTFKPYYETALSVADTLGLCVSTVEDTIIPLLKRMGLIEIERLSPRRHVTKMIPIKQIKGELVNYKLGDHINVIPDDVKKNNKVFNNDEYKIMLKNKKKIAKIKKDYKTEYFVLTKEDLDSIRGINKNDL